MKNALVILCSVILIFGCTDSKTSQVYQNFDKFTKSVRVENGEGVYESTSPKTHKYYERLLTSVIYTDSSSIRGLNVFDQINILACRRIIPKEELLRMSGKEFMIYYFDEIYLSDPAQSDLFSKVKIRQPSFDDKGNAFAELMYEKKRIETHPKLTFNKVDKEYKLNFMSFLKFAKEQLNLLLSAQSMSVNEFVDLTQTTMQMQDYDLILSAEQSWYPLK